MVDLQWREFGSAVLDEAKAQGRPILVLLVTPWCQHCKELLATTFTDEAVCKALAERFVCIRVDGERRPDLAMRFGLGGWPSLCWLTPEGDAIAKDRGLNPTEMLAQIEQVETILAQHRDELDAQLKELWNLEPGESGGELSAQIIEDVVDAIYVKFDHRYGGWGESSKFPHPEAIDFALVMLAKRDDARMREVVTLTLDKMAEGNLHDTIDGGFFRFSKTADWSSPNFEKVLDANAQRLRCYLEAYQLLGKDSYKEVAEGLVRWIMNFMADPDTGAFAGSQDADADYYSLNAADRARRKPPKLDKTVYTNWNSMTISSLLKASVVLEQPELREAATRALSFLIENLYDGEGTVYHYWDGTYHLPGMLADQAYLIRALIDVSQHSGNADLLLPAEAIAEAAIQRQKSPEGGFFDILKDLETQSTGRRRNRSILENAMMAESLVRLSYLSRRREFYDEAIQTLRAFGAEYKQYGYYVAGFGRAVDLVYYPPMIVTIVGPRDDPRSDALRRASLVAYMPSRIVQMLDPKLDPILLGRAGFEAGDAPRAYISIGQEAAGSADSPEDLMRQMDALEQERRQGS